MAEAPGGIQEEIPRACRRTREGTQRRLRRGMEESPSDVLRCHGNPGSIRESTRRHCPPSPNSHRWIGGPDPFKQYVRERIRGISTREVPWTVFTVRGPGTRDGISAERHGIDRRNHPLRRYISDLFRVHASSFASREHHECASHPRLHPR